MQFCKAISITYSVNIHYDSNKKKNINLPRNRSATCVF